MIKHIIFDCDGVLIDTEIVAAEIVSEFLRGEGVDISTDQFIRSYTGKTFTDIIEILKSNDELPQEFNTAEAIPPLDEAVRQNQRPIVGAIDLLKSLKQPFSVVSNSAHDYVELALVKLDVLDLVDGRIFSAEHVAKGKPSPLVYELAINTIGLEKEELVVVEDSSSGVMASTAAGLKTVGFLGGSHILDGHGRKLTELGTFKNVADHDELNRLLSQV